PYYLCLGWLKFDIPGTYHPVSRPNHHACLFAHGCNTNGHVSPPMNCLTRQYVRVMNSKLVFVKPIKSPTHWCFHAACKASFESGVTGMSPSTGTANVTRLPHSGQGLTNKPRPKRLRSLYVQIWHPISRVG